MAWPCSWETTADMSSSSIARANGESAPQSVEHFRRIDLPDQGSQGDLDEGDDREEVIVFPAATRCCVAAREVAFEELDF
jgi:hypothetical protein